MEEQRNISYGELAELENLFDEQTKAYEFESEEQRNEMLNDFVAQYINGEDKPKANYYR